MWAIHNNNMNCIKELLKDERVDLDTGLENLSHEVRGLIAKEKKRRKREKEKKKRKGKMRQSKEVPKRLVAFMDRQILKLEEELKCPVCLEVATTAPIYKCLEDHLLCRWAIKKWSMLFHIQPYCRICRPKLSECPQCRVALEEGRLSYRRFRGAEKQAERLLEFRMEKLATS